MKNRDIQEVLKFDALHEAEKITGKSYKNDKPTEALGFGMHIASGNMKREILESMGDSTFHNDVDNYLKIVNSIGFEVVLKEPFINRDNITEHLFVLWHEEYSILLVFDTHTSEDDGSWAKAGREVPPPSVNGGTFYYHWKPNEEIDRSGLLSSGGMRDGIWVGSHDCREAIKFNISQLAENGTFQKQWIKRPFLWLVNYMDTEGDYDYKALNESRIAKLPQRVIDAITPQ